MSDALLDELLDWLRIPSISTGGGDARDIRRAADWVIERIEAAGGRAELVETAGNPIAYGELTAADPGAPTVLVYGHYDVQSVGSLNDWTTPPFEPDIRDGRIYARGASDDKGNFLPLLHVACELARTGALPVNVRICCEGEEETHSAGVKEWIRDDGGPVDAAIVMDSGMADATTPGITVGLRGYVKLDIRLRTATRDLHSGLYGGSVLNAVHVLTAMLMPVLPGPDGRLRPELEAGASAPGPLELESWTRLKPGGDVIAEAGGRPVHPGAGAEFYARNGAAPALDVNWIEGGEPRTVVPATAWASVTMRLAPGQDPEAIAATLQRMVTDGAPAGADVEIVCTCAQPALFDASEPALQLAATALERATGEPVAFIRSGGSIPIVAEMAARGWPTIVTGFALPEDEIHAPNESYRVESLRLGERAAHELYAALAGLART